MLVATVTVGDKTIECYSDGSVKCEDKTILSLARSMLLQFVPTTTSQMPGIQAAIYLAGELNDLGMKAKWKVSDDLPPHETGDDIVY